MLQLIESILGANLVSTKTARYFFRHLLLSNLLPIIDNYSIVTPSNHTSYKN